MRNYVITIDADGKMSALRQVLMPGNFQNVRPGMGVEEVRRMLGKPLRQVPYKLKNQIVWTWKFLISPNGTKAFNVTFDQNYRMVHTGIGQDLGGPDMRGGN